MRAVRWLLIGSMLVGACSAATSTPPATPNATPLLTAEPRAEWELYPIIGDVSPQDAYAGIDGIGEARGELYALGRAGRDAPGIWVSPDAVNWAATTVPAAPPGLGVSVVDLVDAGTRLVALAAGGLAEGSGLYVTEIYLSDDGRVWRAADRTPGVEAGAHVALVQSGDRLLALGRSVWTSDDGGLTWIETASSDDLGGYVVDAAGGGDFIVAVGQRVGGDLVEPPAYAWISTDDGDSWRRAELDAQGIGHAVAIDRNGRIVALGSVGDRTMAWTSPDAGESWVATDILPCCGVAIVATPTGFVAIHYGYPGPAPHAVLASSDGLTWSSLGIVEFEARAVNWGPRFGLVAGGEDVAALGPNPLP